MVRREDKMMASAKVGPKGQIVIPKEMRICSISDR